MGRNVEFPSTIKGGLPVVVTASIEKSRWEGNVTNGPWEYDAEVIKIEFAHGGTVPDHLITNADLDRLMDEAVEKCGSYS